MSDPSGVIGSVVGTVKDRLTNRLYMYMFSSVITANWQHILIILKSKNDIELTLGIIAYDKYLYFWYFLLPLFIGALLSILMPYCTRFISDLTASQYYLIKNSEKLGQSTIEMKLSKQKEKISEIKLRETKNNLEKSEIEYKRDLLKSQSANYYNWLNGILKAYEETGGKIETSDDLKKILLKLEEHNAVYDLALIPGFKKLMADIQKMN